MSAEYKLRVKTPAGAFQREFNSFNAFAYTKTVNEIGLLTFDVHDQHQVVATLDDSLDNILEVWRRDRSANINWYCDFRGLYRNERREANSDGLSTVRYFCPGPLHLLWRTVVAYRGGVTGRTLFANQPVETIMNDLVKYNATGAGTTLDGRIRDVDLTQVSVEADGGFGTVVSYSCIRQRLLDALQELTRLAPGDFDLVYLGSGQWQYRFYEGQLGTDRSNTVKFALPWGNMDTPTYDKNKMNEQTVAIVGGRGEEETRRLYARIPTYSNYDAAVNSVEFYVDARAAESDAEEDAIADAAVWEARAGSTLTFKTLQTKALRYGRDYFLGDLVRGYYQGINQVMKVWSVTVAMDGSGEEQIELELRKD